MSDFDTSDRYDESGSTEQFDSQGLAGNEDMLLEQILENVNSTPIGQVLKKIASLPEVRKKKVLDVRQQLTEGHYNLNERLDFALDKVLEDLTA
ncbi:flagellar biosynthesis anti-sigma factor FlgM [Planctomycetota bacterium]